jgi:pimeloyl-ACP methyl ester carboxylesterase
VFGTLLWLMILAYSTQVDANAIKAEFLGSGFAPLENEQVRNIHVPTLLITARYSHRIFHRLADQPQELLPDVERIEIDQASHIMHKENAPAYNRAAEAFLDKHRQATAAIPTR